MRKPGRNMGKKMLKTVELWEIFANFAKILHQRRKNNKEFYVKAN